MCKLFYSLFGVFLILSGKVFAEEDAQQISLLELRRCEDLNEMIGYISTVEWPDIYSRNSQAYFKNAGRLGIDYEIYNILIDEVRKHDSRPSDASTLNDLVLYANLLDSIKSKEGYMNYLISDSIRRIIMARITFLILSEPASVDDLYALLERIKPDEVETLNTLKHLIGEYEGLVPEKKRIKSSDYVMSSTLFYRVCGVTVDEIKRSYAYAPRSFSTDYLADEQSVESLGCRILYTEFLANSHLSALLDYLNQGGELSHIDMADPLDFYRIMGNDLSRYSCLNMKIDNFHVGHLQMFILGYQRNAYRSDVLSRYVYAPE